MTKLHKGTPICCDSCGCKENLCQYEGDVTRLMKWDKLGFKNVIGIWILCPNCAREYNLPSPYPDKLSTPKAPHDKDKEKEDEE